MLQLYQARFEVIVIFDIYLLFEYEPCDTFYYLFVFLEALLTTFFQRYFSTFSIRLLLWLLLPPDS